MSIGASLVGSILGVFADKTAENLQESVPDKSQDRVPQGKTWTYDIPKIDAPNLTTNESVASVIEEPPEEGVFEKIASGLGDFFQRGIFVVLGFIFVGVALFIFADRD